MTATLSNKSITLGGLDHFAQSYTTNVLTTALNTYAAAFGTNLSISGQTLKLENSTGTELSSITIPSPSDNIEIGGRNFVLDSDTEKVFTNGSTVSSGDYTLSNYSKSKVKSTDFITFSFDAKASEARWFDMYFYDNSGAHILTALCPSAHLSTEYQHFTLSGVCGINFDSSTVLRCRQSSEEHGSATPGVTIYVKNVKLEKGNKPTDWTAAPEDAVDNALNAVTAQTCSGNASTATTASTSTYSSVTRTSSNTGYDIVLTEHDAVDEISSNRILRSAVNASSATNASARIVPGADASTSGTVVNTELILGNSISSTNATYFAKNRRGRIALYGSGNNYNYIQPNTNTSNITLTLPSSTGTIALESSCDQNIKVDLQDVDVLEKLKTINIKRFHYSQKKIDEKQWKIDNPTLPDSEMPEFQDNEHEPWYIHAMAGEFNKTFDVDDGNPDTIKPINEIGVCLRAIQELAAKVDSLEKQVADLQKQAGI